jgi:hypothetical protein
MYARARIRYSYAAHLRDTGTVRDSIALSNIPLIEDNEQYGFALPPGLIRPVGEETGKMVEYLTQFILKD